MRYFKKYPETSSSVAPSGRRSVLPARAFAQMRREFGYVYRRSVQNWSVPRRTHDRRGYLWGGREGSLPRKHEEGNDFLRIQLMAHRGRLQRHHRWNLRLVRRKDLHEQCEGLLRQGNGPIRGSNLAKLLRCGRKGRVVQWHATRYCVVHTHEQAGRSRSRFYRKWGLRPLDTATLATRTWRVRRDSQLSHLSCSLHRCVSMLMSRKRRKRTLFKHHQLRRQNFTRNFVRTFTN